MVFKGAAGTYKDILSYGLSEETWLYDLAEEIQEREEQEMEKLESKARSARKGR
jgi:hypothetical protein